MATITKQQAVDRLAQAIEKSNADDIVETYKEVFPAVPVADVKAKAPPALLQEIMAHVGAGLYVEEILDLWRVVFPWSRRVWFDEEEGLLHLEEESEWVSQAE